MDMKQLTTFVTLAKTLNYQKAADQLQYAPSTLFKHIQLLEQELGVALLRKSGRQLQLTQEGASFLEHAKTILDSYRKAVQSISPSAGYEGGLTIGGCEINTGNSLIKLFTQFAQQHPDARLSMMTSPNANVPSLVRSDLIDLGYYYSLSDAPLAGMETVKMYQEPAYLLVARDHPLAHKRALRYEDLKGIKFFYPHDSCCFVSALMPVLRERGVELGKITYLGSVQLVVEHVHTEQAMTLMPHCSVDRFCRTHDMAVLELDEAPIMAWEMIVYKNYESLPRLARALLAHSEGYAERLLRSDELLRGAN